ncbi:MAG: glyoxalase [Alphaproteobacteria bacterium]|nr:glyoxalase [Alphaproteobacteria bacterium]
MTIGRLDHYTIRTVDLEATRQFYSRALGFEAGYRPPFNFPGYWLYGDTPYPQSYGIVHLIGIEPGENRGVRDYLGARGPAGPGSGALDHIAFGATDWPGMKRRLESGTIAWRERRVPDLGLLQIFVDDPNGIVIELNFPLEPRA